MLMINIIIHRYLLTSECVDYCMTIVMHLGRSLTLLASRTRYTVYCKVLGLIVAASQFCSVISNQTGMKLGRIVLQVNTHRLTESDF